MPSPLNANPGDLHADITAHDTYVSGFPHAAFERLRTEEPVSWTTEADGSGLWSVTKHADVIEARRSMMELDAPEHTRLRRLVQSGLTPKVTARYESAFRKLVGVVVDRVLPLEEFDFVTEVAREHEIGWVAVRAGDRVVIWYTTANTTVMSSTSLSRLISPASPTPI